MSSFVVSARKYRPIRFDEVVGQEHVSSTLKNALKTGHLAQAYLFCGPRGVGKTTCARILAKVLNCENRTADFEPCNKCRSCEAFNENASMNIIELDAASHNSVENMRTLNEQVRILPQEGKYRIFIIDEVHMLSTAAFNAFLKTLEEPPSYVVFILATTEKHKIIPTILSRCQIYDFRRISITDMVAHLQKVAASEGIEADPDALHLIAQKSDGALRDALSIFDRMVSFSGNALTPQDVVQNLNLLDADTFISMAEALSAGDVPRTLNLFDQILRNGFDGDQFVDGLAQHFRDLLVCKDPNTLNLLEVSESLKEKYRQQAGIFDVLSLTRAIQELNQCSLEFLRANNKRLHIEVSLLKLAARLSGQEKKSPELNETITEPPRPAAVSEKNTPVKENTPAPISPAPKTEQKNQSDKVEPSPEQPVKTPPKPTPQPTPVQLTQTPAFGMDYSDLERQVRKELEEKKKIQVTMTYEDVEKIWGEYAERVSSPTVKSVFSQAVIEVNDPTLTVRVGTEIARTTLLHEKDFIDKLREIYGYDRISIDILIDASLAPEDTPKPKKLLTTKEKYDIMMASNPLINQLRERFDLKLDED